MPEQVADPGDSRTDAGSWNQVTDITIVRGGALGDYIVSLPAFHALRSPHRRLHLIGNASVAQALTADLFASTTSIDDPDVTWLFDPSTRPRPGFSGAAITLMNSPGVAESLRTLGAYPLIADLPHPMTSSSSSVASHIYLATRSAHVASNIAGSFVQKFRDFYTANRDQREIAGATLSFRVDSTANQTPLVSPKSGWTFSSGERMIPHSTRPIAIIHPGSGSTRKNWPLERFQEIQTHLSDLGFQVLILIGPADKEIARSAIATHPNTTVVRDLPLRELAGLLAVSCIFVGNDSGTSHLAAAVGTPTIAVFGPTRAARWAPIGQLVACVEPSQRCDLCLAAESRPVACQCIHQVTPDAVRFAIEKLLLLRREPPRIDRA